MTFTDDSLQRFFFFSAAAHVAVLLFFTVTTYIIGPTEMMLPQAIRVDVVGLPEKHQTLEPPAPSPAPTREAPEPVRPKQKLPPKETVAPPKPVAPVVPTPNPKAKKADLKKAQEKALNELKAKSAIEKMREQMENEKREKETAEKNAKRGSKVAGNAVSEGSVLDGIPTATYDRYLAELQARLNANFEIPQWLADSNLSAVVVIHIDERGYVTRKALKKSSGNQVFDDIVLGTIEKSSPVPPPPDNIKGRLATSGIAVKFPK